MWSATLAVYNQSHIEAKSVNLGFPRVTAHGLLSSFIHWRSRDSQDWLRERDPKTAIKSLVCDWSLEGPFRQEGAEGAPGAPPGRSKSLLLRWDCADDGSWWRARLGGDHADHTPSGPLGARLAKVSLGAPEGGTGQTQGPCPTWG